MTSQRPHVRHTKYGTVHAGKGSRKSRKKSNSSRRGRSGFTGTSHKVMTRGKLSRRRRQQVWSRVAFSSTGSISLMFLTQRRYTLAAVFGIFSLGFGAIDLGMTIHRKHQEKKARNAKEARRQNLEAARRARSTRATGSRTPIRKRARTHLENGTQAARARKPELDTNYRNAQKEKSEAEEKQKAEMGFVG